MKLKGFILGVFLGLVVAAVGMQLIGYTAAIAMPKSVADFIIENENTIKWYIALWDFVVVQIPGIGVVSLLTTYLSIRYLPWSSWWKGIGIAFGAVGIMYGLSPALFTSAFIGHHLYGITMALSVLPLSYCLSRKENA